MSYEPRIGVAILGGGKGIRFGGIVPKPLINVLGHPLIYYSLKFFSTMPNVSSIVITFPKDKIGLLEKALQQYGQDLRRKIVEGGETRAYSSLNALEILKSSEPDIVLIHDAVRPCISKEEVGSLIDALKEYEGAFLGSEMIDTVYKVENSFAIENIERRNLVRAFTPQGFRFKSIYESLKKGIEEGFEGTDDVSYLLRDGKKVLFIPSSIANVKVTYPKDVEVVEAILSGMPCA